MNVLISLAIVFALCSAPAGAATHTITNSDFTFSPSSLTIDAGDTVVFSLESSHNAVEVSEATWNSNGTTPLPGGFSLGFGGGTVVLTTVGIHYYVCQPHAGLGMKGTITVNPVTDVAPADDRKPERFGLTQNYPNPFNPSTTIAFSVAQPSFTQVAVYTSTGRLVSTLVDRSLSAGTYTATWNGTDRNGSEVGSGVYFLRMTADGPGTNFVATRKLLLVR